MIYNDNIAKEYGSSSLIFSGSHPVPYKVVPLANDYVMGLVTRAFAKKVNENKIIEIDEVQMSTINKDLYQMVKLYWKISGPEKSLIVSRIKENTGVEENNRLEIDRVKSETGIDLTSVLPNLLEFWRGY